MEITIILVYNVPMKGTEISDLVSELKKLEMRVNVLSSENKQLRDQIDGLSAKMERLAQSFINVTGAMGDVLNDLTINRREAFERLDLIEMHLFPKAVTTISEAEKIIGKDNGQFFHPLDRREKPKS